MSTVRANEFQGLDAPNPAIELPADGTVILASGFGGNSLPVPSGSSSTPAVAPANDPNTGIYFPEGDAIGFVEGGVEVARISPQGRLGIGLTNPESPLHVETTGETILTVEGSGVAAAGAGGMLLLKNNDTTANNINQIQSADVGGQTTSAISFANVDQANNEGDLRFLTRPSAGSLTERFRFGSAGQFGIGGATFGTTGQVLTSQGASAAPSWADVAAVTTTNVPNLANPAVNDVTVSGIPASATNTIIALANVSTTSTGSPVLSLQMGNGSMNTADYYWVTNYSGSNVQSGSATSSLRLVHTDFNNASNVFNGIIHISESNGRMAVTAQFGVSQSAVQIANTGGSWAGGGTIDRIRIFTSGDNFDNGRMSVHSW